MDNIDQQLYSFGQGYMIYIENMIAGRGFREWLMLGGILYRACPRKCHCMIHARTEWMMECLVRYRQQALLPVPSATWSKCWCQYQVHQQYHSSCNQLSNETIQSSYCKWETWHIHEILYIYSCRSLYHFHLPQSVQYSQLYAPNANFSHRASFHS